jgi:MFS family permease
LLPIIFSVVALNLIDRQIINVLAQDIKVDLALSDAELGLLTGGLFGLVYALTGIPAAWLADRLDRVRVISAMMALWSICTVLCGLAGSHLSLMLARMGVGLGEGGAQPACTAFVRDRFPERPNTALAIMMAGNPIGSFAGFLVGGLVAQWLGWRIAFIVAGVPGILLALFILRRMRASPMPSRRTEPARPLRDLKKLMSRQGMLLLALGTSASLCMMYVAGAWFPAFIIRTFDLTTGEMGLYGALSVGGAGAIGTLCGALADRGSDSGGRVETRMVMVSMTGCLPGLFLMIFATTAGQAIAGLLLYNLFAYLWLAPATRLIQDAAEPSERALAIAVCGGLGICLSLGIGVPATGLISDLMLQSAGPRAPGYAASTIITCTTLIGLVCMGLRLRQLRSVDAGPGVN